MIDYTFEQQGLNDFLYMFGGATTVLVQVSAFLFGWLIMRLFWQSETESILQREGVENADSAIKESTMKKLKKRLSFARIYELFDRSDHLSMRQQYLEQLGKRQKAEIAVLKT